MKQEIHFFSFFNLAPNLEYSFFYPSFIKLFFPAFTFLNSIFRPVTLCFNFSFQTVVDKEEINQKSCFTYAKIVGKELMTIQIV